MNSRQTRQLEFHESNENLIYGDKKSIPFEFSQLFKDLKKGEIYRDVLVEEVFDSGLTAIVYKLNYQNRYYNFKKKREVSLVQNVDGQTSFLNEIQRRIDFENLRKNNSVLDTGIVKTIYANYREGIMLSEWIEGHKIEIFNREFFRDLFQLTWNIEQNGIMEWDLCFGNLLLDQEGRVRLFDFGYMYPYNPLTEYNSEGKANPLFHSVERFETRAFMPYLLKLESENREEVYRLYRIEKEEALSIFEEKEKWLINHEADEDLILTCREQIRSWRKGLESEENLRKLYMIESTRSYVLDIGDDISGKSCTRDTILKIDRMLNIIKNKHEFMKAEHAYLWEDAELSKVELINKYEELKVEAKKHLIAI